MCDKLLILRFWVWTERGFRVFKEGFFFPIGSWWCLPSTTWKQGITLNGDAVVFYGIEIFMSFSSIWDVCVAVGHMMIVWQGRCQVKCVWRKSRGGAVEGWATNQISNVFLLFHGEESRGFSRSGIRLLSPIEVQENLVHNVLKKAKIQFKV